MSDVAINWAKVAGIGGIALFVLLVIFRDVIRLKIFPQLRPGHAYRIILVILTFTFVVACGGIVAWYLISDRELKVSEAAFGLLVGKVFAAEVSKGAPTTSEARAERLARLQYLESQMQNIPETYQRFAKALQRAEQLLAKDDVNAQGAQLRHARDALRQGDVLPTVAMLQKVAESSQSDAAEAHFVAGTLLENSGDFDGALREYVRASQMVDHEEKYFSKAVELALNVGKFAQAEAMLKSKLDLLAAGLIGAEKRGFYLGLSGLAKWYQGNLTDAEADFENAFKSFDGKPSVTFANVLNDSSPIYKSRGLFNVSEERLTRSARMLGCLTNHTDVRYLNVLVNLASVYVLEGEFAAAEAILDKITAGGDVAEVKDPPRKFIVAQSFVVRGNLRRAQGRLQDARTSLLKAVQLLEELRATSTFSYARAQTYLGAIYLDENSLDLAIKRLQGALGQNLQLFGDDHFETANTYALLSAAWIRRGDLQRGRSLLDDAKRGLSDKMQASLLRARVNELEGELRLREDDVGAAGKLVESACHIYEAVPGVDRIRLIDCLQNLARIYRKAGRNADADALSARALKIRGISSRQKTADVLQAKC